MADVQKSPKDELATGSSTADQIDGGIKAVSRGIGNTVATTQQAVSQSYGLVVHHLDHAKEYLDYGVATVRVVQDAAVDGVKGAIKYAGSNPYTAYSTATGAALLILPGTRRLLWRYTLGRFSSPADVIKRSEDKLNRLKSQALDYSAKAKTLEERMLLGEEELKAGFIKLKSARKELQQLASSISSSQATATGVVRNLRAIKHVDGSLAVRGEAANQAKAFKEQLSQVNKHVYRIASKDI